MEIKMANYFLKFLFHSYLNVEHILRNTMYTLILENLKNLWNLDNKCTSNNEITDKFAYCEL